MQGDMVQSPRPSSSGLRTGHEYVDTRMTTSTPGAAKCSYSKKGVCSIHGPGAKQQFRMVSYVKTGTDGKKTRGTIKKAYYTCDLGLKGGRLIQNKLSFVKTTLLGGQEIKDTADIDLNTSTSKEGQELGSAQTERFGDF